MEILQQKYSFSLGEPLSGLYQDSDIRCASYRAVRKSDDKEVQVVIYYSAKHGQVTSYYKRIAKFAQVRHHNLTPILECLNHQETNQLFVVLEWTPAYSLKEYLGDNVLNWKSAYLIIKDVLCGLRELHKEGLVYSFINLENIQVCEGRGRLSFRYLIYKTYYLAPEVKENHQKSQESDLFSTGVCLFRMVFGSLPFKSKNSAEYSRSVKSGVARRVQGGCFPKIIPKELQQYINTLCHFVPQERLIYLQKQSILDSFVQGAERSINVAMLDGRYVVLSVQSSSEQFSSATVIDIDKRKHKQQKRVFHMEVIRHNLTEISSYVDQIVIPFKNAANLNFANIQEFYVVQKDCLVIVYDYCAQGSLKEYSQSASFSREMTEQTTSVLRNLLSQWKGQYRFLTNEEVLINSGRPVLKYPPFPTADLKAKLKLSRKGNHFIAPEVQAGIQSLTADSWSVGAIEFWMMFGQMPLFAENGELIINDKSLLTPDKQREMSQLLCKKHRERKNLFPIENKPIDRKISSDSYSSSESPRLSSRIKSIPNAPKALRMTEVTEEDGKEIEDDIQQFQILSPKYHSTSKKENKTRKKVQSGHKVTNRTGTQAEDEEDLIEEEVEPAAKLQMSKQLRNRRSPKRKQTLELKQLNQDNILDELSPVSRKASNEQNIFSSQLNLIQKVEQTPKDAPLIRRFPTFDGGKDERKTNHRDSIPKARDRQSTKAKKDSPLQKSTNSRRITMHSAICVQPMNNDDKLLSEMAKEGWRLSLIEKHWSKPIRIVFKGLLALLMCIFMFYFSFLSINGSLMKNRYDYSSLMLSLRSDSLATTPTINFAAVTRTPLDTYNSLNNQTLTYIRDSQKCVTNDYSNRSNVAQILSSSSFGTYQAFGFIIVILNLLLLCLSLAKFDFPKALSLTQFDDHFYNPLYNWLLVNLALASLTSCTFLAYGGLFDLQLDPCVSRSSFPSLTYLLKNEASSFIWRFLWAYVGLGIAYTLIIYLIINPRANVPKYLFICLILLYFAGVGIRAFGTYQPSLYSVFGACGELLSLLIGIPLLLIDIVVSYRLRKIQKSGKAVKGVEEASEIVRTEDNFNV